MSISSSLGNALSGLNVSSRMAETVSSNLANAMTEGYGRRGLEVSSYGGGVKVDGMTRAVDRGLLGDRRMAEARLNADQRSNDMLAKVEAIIGTAESPDSIAARLTNFENALIAASSDPASEQRLSQVNGTLGALVEQINNDSKQIQSLRQEADRSIQSDIETLNTNLKMLEQINADISRTRNSGQDPSSLFDARQQVVDEISSIVPVREMDRGNDQIGLITTSGLILIDVKATQFEFSPTPTIVAEMTLASGGLSGITLRGAPLDADNGVGRLSGGSLGAAFKMRDESLVAAQQGLDDLSFDLITRFSDPLVDPTAGSIGLLTDAGAALDPMTVVGLSGRIAVNAAVDPQQGGNLAAWRDGIGATTAGPTGNAAQLDRWRNGLTSSFGSLGMSASDALATFSSNMSAMDLSRFDAAPLIAFTATEESYYGTETNGRIPARRGAHRADQWAYTQASG